VPSHCWPPELLHRVFAGKLIGALQPAPSTQLTDEQSLAALHSLMVIVWPSAEHVTADEPAHVIAPGMHAKQTPLRASHISLPHTWFWLSRNAEPSALHVLSVPSEAHCFWFGLHNMSVQAPDSLHNASDEHVIASSYWPASEHRFNFAPSQ
jgi:hypothetical protein